MRLLFASAVIALCAAAEPAKAQYSSFTLGSEGWVTGDLFTASCCGAVAWHATGGNPGGYIRVNDVFAWNAIWAPAAFLGDKSSVYGSSLSFSSRIVSSDGVAYPNVVLIGSGMTIQYRTAPPPNNVWTAFTIPMLETGWEIADGSGTPGPAVSAVQFQGVLSSLTSLRIEADWQTGGDQVDLDEVRLGPAGDPGVVPEPSSILLLGSGMAAIALSAFRNRRRR